jgi:hypothetical protein
MSYFIEGEVIVLPLYYFFVYVKIDNNKSRQIYKTNTLIIV